MYLLKNDHYKDNINSLKKKVCKYYNIFKIFFDGLDETKTILRKKIMFNNKEYENETIKTSDIKIIDFCKKREEYKYDRNTYKDGIGYDIIKKNSCFYFYKYIIYDYNIRIYAEYILEPYGNFSINHYLEYDGYDGYDSDFDKDFDDKVEYINILNFLNDIDIDNLKIVDVDKSYKHFKNI